MGFLRLPKFLSKKRSSANSGRKLEPDCAMDDTSRTLDCSSRSDDSAADALGERRSLPRDAGLDVPLDELLDLAHDASRERSPSRDAVGLDCSYYSDWDDLDGVSAPSRDIEDILRSRDDVAHAPLDELPDHPWDIEPVVQRVAPDGSRPERPGFATSLSNTSSSSSSSSASRVSFVDEARGLTPRHVVTQVHHIPRITKGEKRQLYYTKKDFAVFQKEELYD